MNVDFKFSFGILDLKKSVFGFEKVVSKQKGISHGKAKRNFVRGPQVWRDAETVVSDGRDPGGFVHIGDALSGNVDRLFRRWRVSGSLAA